MFFKVYGGQKAMNTLNIPQPLRFCGSALWMRQVLQEFPVAIQEKEFIVPGDPMLSHCERRNLTDYQETAQWLGGSAVARCVLKSLLSALPSTKEQRF